jgi:peroxiredoxin
MEKIGQYAPDFELPGIDGNVHHLARYLDKFQAVGVIIMCNHCPYVHRYLDRLKQIQTDFQAQNFTLIGINANDEQQYPADSFDKMKAFAAENQLNFPYLRDVTQDVAQSFAAQRTPEAFLLNQSGVICYSGAVDDNVQDPAAVQVHYLRDAITQLLASQAIAQSAAPAVGCTVKWRT